MKFDESGQGLIQYYLPMGCYVTLLMLTVGLVIVAIWRGTIWKQGLCLFSINLVFMISLMHRPPHD